MKYIGRVALVGGFLLVAQSAQAEVIIGLLELDHRSFMGSNRNWSPLDSADKVGSNGVTSIYQMLTA